MENVSTVCELACKADLRDRRMSLQGKILRTYPLIHRPYYYNYIYVIRIKDILIIGAVDKWISPAKKRTGKRTVISMAPTRGVTTCMLCRRRTLDVVTPLVGAMSTLSC